MRHSFGDHQHNPVIHFKKKWLQEEREALAASNRDLCHSPRSPRLSVQGYDSPSPLSTPETTAPLRVPFEAIPSDSPPIMLNIPRFSKYRGLLESTSIGHAPLHGQLSADSSAITDSQDASLSDRPLLLKMHLKTERSHGGAPAGDLRRRQAQQQQQEHCTSERMLIDINKPPPSPTREQEMELMPSTPCSAPPQELHFSPADFALPAMDYSLSPSHLPSWLAVSPPHNGDVVSQRKSIPSPPGPGLPARTLLHLPSAKHQLGLPGSPLPGSARTTLPRGKDLHFPLPAQHGARGFFPQHLGHAQERHTERSPSSRGVTVRRICMAHPPKKPRSILPLAEDLGRSASGHQDYLHGISPLPQHEEESVDDGGAEEDDDCETEASKKEGAEEQLSKGGVPKACLHCGTTKTPLWRNGPPGPKSLCNACGIRFNKIRSGKRKPTPKEATMLLKYERCNSTSSGTSEVIIPSPEKCTLKQHRPQQSQAEQQLQKLPVATALKSRSHLGQHRQSNLGESRQVTDLPVVKRKREPVGNHQQAEGHNDGKYSGLAFSPKEKGLCLTPEAQQKLARSIWEDAKSARDRSQDCFAGRFRSINEGARDLDDMSSSDHESCLSEPVQSPTASASGSPCWENEVPGLRDNLFPPTAPVQSASDEEVDHVMGSSSCRGVPEGVSDDGDSDVEMGARLLMEILCSARGSITC